MTLLEFALVSENAIKKIFFLALGLWTARRRGGTARRRVYMYVQLHYKIFETYMCGGVGGGDGKAAGVYVCASTLHDM